MVTANQSNLQSQNDKFAESFAHGKLAAPPAKKYVVVTCMDARIDPVRAFGIEIGDAHVIRNAGGNARDAIRSIVISNQLLATTEILVIKHTKCGMLGLKNDDAHAAVEKNLGSAAKDELGHAFDFQPFTDLEQSVKDDVEYLKKSKLVADSADVSGYIYDVETGKTKHVA